MSVLLVGDEELAGISWRLCGLDIQDIHTYLSKSIHRTPVIEKADTHLEMAHEKCDSTRGKRKQDVRPFPVITSY